MPAMLQKNNAIQIILFLLFLILPFSHFLFNKSIDIWHAQGYLCQLGILCAFSYYLFLNNRPLGLLTFWAGLVTLFYWVSVHISEQKYAFGVFMPFFNFLCVIILYELLIKFEPHKKILQYIPYILFILIGYSILQKFNLDQFYLDANTNPEIFKDNVVGTIGNSMHFSHYMAIMLPFLFLHKYNKILIFLAVGIIALTNSFSGILVSILTVIFFNFFKRIYRLKEVLFFLVLGTVFLFYKHIDFDFLSSNGRIDMWGKYFKIFTQRPITGWGLGIVNILSKSEGFTGWRHLHNEYYHHALELGIIGVLIILYGIWDYFKRFFYAVKTDTVLVMGSIFLAFLLISLFGYPSHLWLLSSLGILGYSYMYTEV